DDISGCLSSSTVQPINIYKSNKTSYLDDVAPSEISAADSCNTGSVSSDRGYRNFISNPSGLGERLMQTRQKSKQTSINPSNPPKTIIKMTSNLRRWQHAFPKVRQHLQTPSNLIRSEVYTDGLSSTDPWRGLLSPASLPLTTDFFPSKEDLQELYSEYVHLISPSEDISAYEENERMQHKKAARLMTELIYHRLAQGFQLIVVHPVTLKSLQLHLISRICRPIPLLDQIVLMILL